MSHKKNNSSDLTEEELFNQAMRYVKPLQKQAGACQSLGASRHEQQQKAMQSPHSQKDLQTQAEQRALMQAAFDAVRSPSLKSETPAYSERSSKHSSPLSDMRLDDFIIEQDEQCIAVRRSSISRKILYDLKRGYLVYHQKIDLHYMTQDEAQLKLKHFIEHAYQQQERYVMVITGQGKNSPMGVAVLRRCLLHWLTEKPLSRYVLAFCNASIKDGGLGAFYVLLKKSSMR